MTRAERIVRWFMFSVLISLVPLALTYFGLRLDQRPVRLEMLVARGELLLICTTLGAAALGELFPGSPLAGLLCGYASRGRKLHVLLSPGGKMTIETVAIGTSAIASCMSILAIFLGRHSSAAARRDQTITITIEDSSGTRTRMVTRSNRRVADVKRDFERLVASTP
jgi:hypothetical protein